MKRPVKLALTLAFASAFVYATALAMVSGTALVDALLGRSHLGPLGAHPFASAAILTAIPLAAALAWTAWDSNRGRRARG